MELTDLRDFLVLVREGSISNAAKTLHTTQPSLSRRMAALEDDLGRQLYTRSRKGIELNDYGVMLYRYAESIVDLSDRAEEAIRMPAQSVSGIVRIGAGETCAMGTIAEAMKRTRASYPKIEFEVYSGKVYDLLDNLVRGYYDFLVECELRPHAKLNTMELPQRDLWVALMRRDDPLASRESISPKDLEGRPVLMSQQAFKIGILKDWLGDSLDRIDVASTYSLPLNATFLAKQGFGILLTYEYEGLFETDELHAIPLAPRLESIPGVAWRKVLPSKQAQLFLDQLTALCGRGVSL